MAKNLTKSVTKKVAKKISKIPLKKLRKKSHKISARKADQKQTPRKIDETLLNLPHSSLIRINKSLKKLENMSSDLAEKNGLAGILGRAILLRASAIRESLNAPKKAKSPHKKSKAK